MKRLALLAGVCAALCGCSAVVNYPIIANSPKADPSPTGATCVNVPQNASRIGFGVTGVQALTAVEQLTGVRAAWTLEYPEFGDAFDAATTCRYSQIGATPILQIDPYKTSLALVAAGDYDAYLRTYALTIKRFAAPVILSFGHEMNGDWYSWGWTHTPAATFVAAWRHIVGIFQTEHVTNATWMWTVNIDRPGSTVAQPVSAWWPGNRYVQMVGIDGYFRYAPDTWDAVFSYTLSQVRHITGDPVLVSETGVEQDPNSYAQTTQLFQGIEQNHLVGFVWLNENADKNWLLQDDPAALAGFKQAVTNYERS